MIERQHYDLNRSEHVRDLIERKLGPGDDASAIESFFEAQGIEYTYDRFAKRYQAIVRNVSPDAVGDHAIVIYVNVNEEKKYRSYEVYDSLD